MALRDDRLKWNQRYRDGAADAALPEPHPLALAWRHRFAGGALLDAACGRGRGIASGLGAFSPLYAVDASEVAIAQAQALWVHEPAIRWIVGDVTALAWPRRAFGLICAFGFTDLPFFRRVPELLRRGGLFFYEGFAPRQLEVNPGLNPAWVAGPETLREILAPARLLECGVSGEPPYRTRLAAVAEGPAT